MLIVHLYNPEAKKIFGLCRRIIKMCTGARYLGGFIGDDEYKRDWLKDRTETWERNIHMISKNSDKCPQESYSSLVCEI